MQTAERRTEADQTTLSVRASYVGLWRVLAPFFPGLRFGRITVDIADDRIKAVRIDASVTDADRHKN